MKDKAPRTVDELLASAVGVLTEARRMFPSAFIAPLFSGGYDSLSACTVASLTPNWGGTVYHIDTGIGSKATRAYVEKVCKEEKWKLYVLKSKDTYEKFIRERGFPGPGGHQWVYNRIKDRCIRTILRYNRPKPVILVTGCRSQESTRRMGNVAPIQVGEKNAEGVTHSHRRVWVAPCHDWSGEEQLSIINHFAYPRNPVKESALGMSGECFCGAFASVGELELIREIVPDVAAEIDRLQLIARECNTPCLWGERPAEGRKALALVPTGPMCTSCDYRANKAGVEFVNREADSEGRVSP